MAISDDDFALNQIAAAVQTVAGYVPLSVRYRAAAAALMVVEEYFATPIPARQFDGPGGDDA